MAVVSGEEEDRQELSSDEALEKLRRKLTGSDKTGEFENVVRDALETLRRNSLGLSEELFGTAAIQIENETNEAYSVLKEALGL